MEPTEDLLSPEDQAIVWAGLQAFADGQSMDENPHGPDLAAPDERMAMLWRKGFLDGAVAQGRIAANDGKPIESNPFLDESIEQTEDNDDCAEAWTDGWNAYTNELLSTQAKGEQEKPLAKYLNELEDACKAAEDEWNAAKKHASELKKVFEAAVLRLRGAVRQSKADEPLFAQPTEADSAIKDSDPPPPSNEWRNAGIDVLGLTVKQIEKFAERGISTIGELEDLRGGDGLLSVDGIGRATVDKIEDALIEWLSANRDAAALQEAAA